MTNDKKPKAQEGETPSVPSVEELQQTIATQEALIAELEAKLAGAEKTIETGFVTVKSGESEYKVLTPFVPALSQAQTVGATKIAAAELHKHPEVIAELIAIGSGILQPLN